MGWPTANTYHSHGMLIVEVMRAIEGLCTSFKDSTKMAYIAEKLEKKAQVSQIHLTWISLPYIREGFLPYDGDEVTLSEYNVLVEYKSPQSVKKGRFKTMKEAGSWKTLQSQPGNKFSRMIPILTTSSSPSRIAFWLDEMDVRVNDNRWRVQSFVDSIALDGFYAHIKTWSPNVLFGAGFLSMQIESTDPEFRCGVVCHKAATIQRVSFDWRYERPPVVFIALCGFDIGRSPYISIKGDKVDCTGFDLEVEARNDTTTHKAWTTWIAFPENSKAIQYGSFSACDGQTIGSVTFSPAFDRPPTILTGFTKLDVSRLNIRLCIEAENVSHVGMDWRISTWSDSKINHVGANYIAFV